jgi:hypothetical protein
VINWFSCATISLSINGGTPLVGRPAADAQLVTGRCAFNGEFATCFLWLYFTMAALLDAVCENSKAQGRDEPHACIIHFDTYRLLSVVVCADT